jgi:hypothetical protein
VHGFGVPVLRILNEEHHQESDDGSAGVDNELPRVRKIEHRTGNGPDGDDEKSNNEGSGVSKHAGRFARKNMKGIAQPAEEVLWFFFFVRA